VGEPVILRGALGLIPLWASGGSSGALVKGGAGAGCAQLIYLPVSFCPGLWIPLSVSPHALLNRIPCGRLIPLANTPIRRSRGGVRGFCPTSWHLAG